MIETSHSTSTRAVTRVAAYALAIVSAAVTSIVGIAAPTAAITADDSDWLSIVNTYRAMSGLSPVTPNATWSAQARDHSCYMLQNGITHDETPGNPGYTPGGDIAGNSGNVAVSSSVNANARNHIDLWMTGPFHAIGILRHSLTQSGFGLCTGTDTPTSWRSGGTLDVIRGIDASKPRPSQPIVFPGEGSTVPLNAFITEYPNPMTLCGWTGSAGLPLIAMMPNKVSNASATITGPSGPVPTCALHAGNTGADATARAILDGDNAVVVMPREVLANGAYTVRVNSDGGAITWSFNVDTTAPLSAEPPAVPDTEPSASPAGFEQVDPFRLVDTRKGLGTTKLRAGKTVRIKAAEPDVVALSANFVAVNPTAPGHLTLFNCSSEMPNVSTVGYVPGNNIANQAIVSLSDGDFCVYAHAATELVVDVNGYYHDGARTAEFMPVNPRRLYDSRKLENGRLKAGVERQVKVVGVKGGGPAGANAVSLNVTTIKAPDFGHLQVYPCGATNSLETSTVNYGPGEVRPNTVVVGTDDDGKICLRSHQRIDVAIDLTGYFDEVGGLELSPLDPIRLFDSRRSHSRLNQLTSGSRVRAGQVVRIQIAGDRGIPKDAKAASVNITGTRSSDFLHITAYPCGARPNTSNLNLSPGSTAANGAMVKLSDSGELCVYTLRDVHLIIDINGVWR